MRPTWRVDSPGSDESHISYEGEDEIDMFSDYEDNGEESEESDELQNGSPTPAISRRVLTRHHEVSCTTCPADDSYATSAIILRPILCFIELAGRRDARRSMMSMRDWGP